MLLMLKCLGMKSAEYLQVTLKNRAGRASEVVQHLPSPKSKPQYQQQQKKSKAKQNKTKNKP
jgi:hypothetical protein